MPLLFAFTGGTIAIAAIILFSLIGIIYQFTIKNRFARLDVDLDALVQTRTALLSQITTTINQSVEVAEQSGGYAQMILDAITKARIASANELFRVLTEAQIPVNPNVYQELLPTIQGFWAQMSQKEVSIQSVLASRNTMLVTVPEKWFLSGTTREIPPIVTAEASEMADTGILTTKPLFTK